MNSGTTGETRAAESKDLFGHPRGLAFLFATEMWERFSYYGMNSLLVLYMVTYLFHPGRAETVLGYSTIKRILESIFGPLDVQPLASIIYGFHTGLVYLAPVFGGLLADRVLGQRRSVIIGAVLMAIGHFMMAFEMILFPALLMLILGNGAFKPNISTQVGALYPPGDPRRDRAYSIFYVGINIGSAFSPLVSGTLGLKVGWHYGFGAAGVGMLISLAIYLYALPRLPADELAKYRASRREKTPLDRGERRRVLSLYVICLIVVFFWATYEQQSNTVVLWAEYFTDRSINLRFWNGEIPTPWFLSFNSFLIFAFTPLIVRLWAWQAKRRSEPSTVTKMALGFLGVALANLIMVGASWTAGEGRKENLLWLLGYGTIITLGELYLAPVGLALVSKVAPPRMLSTMMGVWLATSFPGDIMAGWLGSFWSGMTKSTFFLMIAAIAGAAGGIIFCLNRPLKPVLDGEREQRA